MCGIYVVPEHSTDMYPQLQKDATPQVNVIGGFGSQPRKYNPYSNHYNPGWRDHSNMRYGQPSNQP
jgi:hypothetical protein